MGFLFPKPKPPPVVQPTPKEVTDEAALAAGNRERRRAATRGGFQSTVLTGPQGASPQTGGEKTLLGS